MAGVAEETEKLAFMVVLFGIAALLIWAVIRKRNSDGSGGFWEAITGSEGVEGKGIENDRAAKPPAWLPAIAGDSSQPLYESFLSLKNIIFGAPETPYSLEDDLAIQELSDSWVPPSDAQLTAAMPVVNSILADPGYAVESWASKNRLF